MKKKKKIRSWGKHKREASGHAVVGCGGPEGIPKQRQRSTGNDEIVRGVNSPELVKTRGSVGPGSPNLTQPILGLGASWCVHPTHVG